MRPPSGSKTHVVDDDIWITIRNQSGKEVTLRRNDVTVSQLEKEFKMIRVHLEGTDHSAIFPDKDSGEFTALKSGITYTIWGHKWKEELRFKPAPTQQDLPLNVMMELLKPKLFVTSTATNDASGRVIEAADSTPSSSSSGSPNETPQVMSPVVSSSPQAPFLKHKAQSTMNLMDRTEKDKSKVLIVSKKGKQKYFYCVEVTATAVEEEFQLVKTHLEGSDHSARFPDKETGRYEKLKPEVVYTIS